MVVITLEKCPSSLRGDLTKWLQEICVGVYVGQVSARVRDNLWKRVCTESKRGRTTMVYSARNEQHLDFRVHNAVWEPIDFDGVKLMLRPSATRLKERRPEFTSYSAASKRKYARGRGAHAKKRGEPEAYVVVDIETTGLDADRDEIIEIGALKVIEGNVVDDLGILIRPSIRLPNSITDLTKITQSEVDAGAELETAMRQFLRFIGTYPLVMHNAAFDIEFIDAALEKVDIDSIENQLIDTMVIARRSSLKLTHYSLDSLCDWFGIEAKDRHRGLADCYLTRKVFLKLLDHS